MTPPDTNLQKQKRWHKAPLAGIAIAVVFAFGLFLFWITYVVEEGVEPEGAEVQIDGRTGEPVTEDEPTLVDPPEQ